MRRVRDVIRGGLVLGAGASCVLAGAATAAPDPLPPDFEAPHHYQMGAEVPGILMRQADPVGEHSVRWSRSSSVAVRIEDIAVTRGSEPACNLRLQVAGAPPTAPPLREWIAPSDPEDPTCSGIAPTGTYAVPAPWRTGVTTLELRASRTRHPTEPGKLLAGVELRVDDVPPVVSWPVTPDVVAGGTRVKVLPDYDDPESGVIGTATGITDDQGRPYVFEQEAGGSLVVAPGRTLVIDTTVTDAVGNATRARKTITGLPDGTPSPLRTAVPPAAHPVSEPCAGSRRSSVTLATRASSSRRISVAGCRPATRGHRIQVRVVRRGGTSTRTYALPGTGRTFARTIRLRTGDRALRVRVGRAGTWSAWVRVTSNRR